MEAAALELEDDVFFKDLSKQISLLIMDDDDGPLSYCPSVNLQAFNQVILPSPSAQASYSGYNQETSKRGTGVFIPRSTNRRRKNAKQQQGKSSAASGNKVQRHCDHSSRGLPQMPYASNIDHSSNPRRF